MWIPLQDYWSGLVLALEAERIAKSPARRRKRRSRGRTAPGQDKPASQVTVPSKDFATSICISGRDKRHLSLPIKPLEENFVEDHRHKQEGEVSRREFIGRACR